MTTLKAADLYYFRVQSGLILATIEMDGKEFDLEIEFKRGLDDEPIIDSIMLEGDFVKVEGLEEVLDEFLPLPNE